jgi:hypothetical protein
MGVSILTLSQMLLDYQRLARTIPSIGGTIEWNSILLKLQRTWALLSVLTKLLNRLGRILMRKELFGNFRKETNYFIENLRNSSRNVYFK